MMANIPKVYQLLHGRIKGIFVWDATYSDMFAPSYVDLWSGDLGTVATGLNFRRNRRTVPSDILTILFILVFRPRVYLVMWLCPLSSSQAGDLKKQLRRLRPRCTMLVSGNTAWKCCCTGNSWCPGQLKLLLTHCIIIAIIIIVIIVIIIYLLLIYLFISSYIIVVVTNNTVNIFSFFL